jgi:hypothetical protein
VAASEVTERAGAGFAALRVRRRSLIAAVAAAALAPAAAGAQTPPPAAPNAGVLTPPNGMFAATIADPNAALLQPSLLQGNPATLPRFRRGQSAQDQAPPTGTFTAPAPSRIGATPVYGSPPAFGAGNSGFDSDNLSKRKKKALKDKAPPPPGPGVTVPETTFEPLTTTTQFNAAPPQPSKAPPPEVLSPQQPQIYPAKAQKRPGAALPDVVQPLPISNPPPEIHPLSSANRPGATTPIPPQLDTDAVSTPGPGTPALNSLPLGAPPTRPLPLAATDPYAPLGIRGGSFMFFPAVELSAGYATNPTAVPGGAPSPYFIVAPELQVASLWSRHSLTANITSSYIDYTNGSFQPSPNRPYLNSKIDGRIDVTRDTQILLQQRVLVSTDNPGSPNIGAGLATLPIDTTVGGTLGVAQQFSRLSVAVKGTVDRLSYQNSTLTDGSTASNADRDLNQYGGVARIGYELNPGFKPFTEIQADSRIYDQLINAGGNERNSNGVSAKVGATLDMFGSLTGEMAIGYIERKYFEDATLPKIAGVTLDGSLLWQATALTSAKLTASSVVNETTLTDVSGELSRDINLQVDHALRRWLIGTMKFGYGQDDYVGSPRVDNRYFVSAGITYKLNREMQLKGEVRKDWLNSSQPGASYQSTSFLAGLRLQR